MIPQEALQALDEWGFTVMRFLLTVLWQSSILLVATAVIARALRNRRASARHTLWLSALLVAPLLPVLAALVPFTGAPQVPVPVIPSYETPEFVVARRDATPLAPTVTEQPPPMVQEAPLAPESPQLDPLAYPWALTLIAYALGLSFFLGSWVLGHARIRTWIRSASPCADSRVMTAFEQARTTLGKRGRIGVLECPKVSAPITVGLLRPVVLLPVGLNDELSDVELQATALHETAHAKRRDPLVLTVVALVRSVLFFHPLVWLACRQIRMLAEHAADSAVLEAAIEPVPYAELLTRIAARLPRRTPASEYAAGIVLSKSVFLGRIEDILSDRRDQIRKLTRWALAGTVVAGLLSVAVALAVPLGQQGSGESDEEGSVPGWLSGQVVGGLQVSIAPEKARYALDEPIHVQWRIENLGDEDCQILWHELPHYSPVRFEIGKDGEEKYVRDDVRGAFSHRIPAPPEVITLRPDESRGAVADLRRFLWSPDLEGTFEVRGLYAPRESDMFMSWVDSENMEIPDDVFLKQIASGSVGIELTKDLSWLQGQFVAADFWGRLKAARRLAPLLGHETVLAELERQYPPDNNRQLVHTVGLMAKLGDRRHVDEVIDVYENGGFAPFEKSYRQDMLLFLLNWGGERGAHHLRRYLDLVAHADFAKGTDEWHDRNFLLGVLTGSPFFLEQLKSDETMLPLLVLILDIKSESHSPKLHPLPDGTVAMLRWCDDAGLALQDLLERDWGLRPDLPIDKRDVIIATMREELADWTPASSPQPERDGADTELSRVARNLVGGAETPNGMPVFGPVIELTCPADPERGTFIDLETDKGFDLPAELAESQDKEALLAWCAETGVDVSVRFGGGKVKGTRAGRSGVEVPATTIDPGVCYIGSVESSFYASPETDWDTTAADVANDTTLRDREPGFGNITVLRDKLPETQMFKTRDGSMGLFQVVEFTDDPNGVRIRYKMLAQGPVTAATGPPATKESSMAGGGPGRISGVVVSAETGERVPGAFVAVDHSGDAGGANLGRFREQGIYVTAETDAQGRFVLEGVALREHPFYITCPGFVRHERTVTLDANNPDLELTISLKPAAVVNVAVVDAEGNPVQAPVILRLGAVDSRVFVPMKEDWPRFGQRTEHVKRGGVFTFDDLDSGTFSIEAIQMSPGHAVYHGMADLTVQAGETRDVAIPPADNRTKVVLAIAEDPYQLERIPLRVIVSRNPGLLLWADGKFHHPEDERLGRMQSEMLVMLPVGDDGSCTLDNLPEGTYAVLVMTVGQYKDFKSPSAYVRGVRAEVSRGAEQTVEIPWVEPLGPAVIKTWMFNNNAGLGSRAHSAQEICELLSLATGERIGFTVDASIRDERVTLASAQMSVWEALEFLYLTRGWVGTEKDQRTFLLQPSRPTRREPDEDSRPETPAASAQTTPQFWVSFFPRSPIRSLDEYQHAMRPRRVDVEKVRVESCTFEIRSVANGQSVLSLPYLPGTSIATATTYGEEGSYYSGGIDELPAEALERVGSLPHGDYTVSFRVNGVLSSNVAPFQIDSNYTTESEPALKITAVEGGPGRDLPWIGVRIVGPDPKDPEFTIFNIVFHALVVDGIERKPTGIMHTGGMAPIQPGQVEVRMLDLAHFAPAIEPGLPHEVYLRAGQQESNRIALNADAQDAGLLTFRLVAEEDGEEPYDVLPVWRAREGESETVKVEKKVLVDKSAFKRALVRPNPDGGGYMIFFSLDKEAGRRFGEITGANIGRRLATVYRNEVLSAPVIQSQIYSQGSITGSLTEAEAQEIAAVIHDSPVKAKVIEETPSEQAGTTAASRTGQPPAASSNGHGRDAVSPELAVLCREVVALEKEQQDLAWQRWNALSVLEQGRLILRYQNQRPPTEKEVAGVTEEQARRLVEYWRKRDAERGTKQLLSFASYLVLPEEARSCEQRRVAIVERITALGEVAIPGLIDEILIQGAYQTESHEGLRGMGPLAVPFVLEALETATDSKVRSSLLKCFGRTNDPKVRQVLLDALDDPATDVRKAALSALERQGP